MRHGNIISIEMELLQALVVPANSSGTTTAQRWEHRRNCLISFPQRRQRAQRTITWPQRLCRELEQPPLRSLRVLAAHLLEVQSSSTMARRFLLHITPQHPHLTGLFTFLPRRPAAITMSTRTQYLAGDRQPFFKPGLWC